jgi:recombination protein RecT
MADPRAIQKAGEQTALAFIQSHRADFIRVIPKHLTPERLLRIAESSIRRSPDIAICTPASIVRSVMEASILGLEPGVLGDGWLIAYNVSVKQGGDWHKVKECQFQPGYQGLTKLAIQSKSVASINVGAVYADDVLDYALGSSPYLKHRPSLAVRAVDTKAILYYCAIKLVSGGKQLTVMSLADVERIRQMSMSKNSDRSPWSKHFEQMGIKTVVKRALKMVPKSPEVSRGIAMDDRREIGESSKDLFVPDLLPEHIPGEEAQEEKDAVQAAVDLLGAEEAESPGEKP